MTCQWITLPDGTRALVKLSPPPKCHVCKERRSTKLCDFPKGNGKTCDRRLCDRCAVHVGPDLDHCPDHPKLTAELRSVRA